MYHAATKVGHEDDFLRRRDALHNAQDALAYVLSRFRADCAAMAIRTAQDAEKRFIRIQVALA